MYIFFSTRCFSAYNISITLRILLKDQYSMLKMTLSECLGMWSVYVVPLQRVQAEQSSW